MKRKLIFEKKQRPGGQKRLREEETVPLVLREEEGKGGALALTVEGLLQSGHCPKYFQPATAGILIHRTKPRRPLQKIYLLPESSFTCIHSALLLECSRQ
jgi:hypothetical protein